MQRFIVSVGAFALLFAGTTALHAQESARARELRHRLNQPVRFGGFEDPKITFIEGLEYLAKTYDLAFDINEQAFKDSDIKEVGKLEPANPTPVPPMQTKLGTVLKKLLLRVSPTTTYVIRDDMIEVTTTKAIRKELFADRPRGPLPPLVSSSFDKASLESACKELSQPSLNIVLDGRVAKEAMTPVTADLVNVPLDTAVGLLADMAGLKVVPIDNVLYVTSKDNARALMEEREKLRLHQQQIEKEKKEQKQKQKKDKPNEKTEKPAKATAKQ